MRMQSAMCGGHLGTFELRAEGAGAWDRLNLPQALSLSCLICAFSLEVASDLPRRAAAVAPCKTSEEGSSLTFLLGGSVATGSLGFGDGCTGSLGVPIADMLPLAMGGAGTLDGWDVPSLAMGGAAGACGGGIDAASRVCKCCCIAPRSSADIAAADGRDDSNWLMSCWLFILLRGRKIKHGLGSNGYTSACL